MPAAVLVMSNPRPRHSRQASSQTAWGRKKVCTKAYLAADCSLRTGFLFLCLSSAVSSSITHLSAMSWLDVFFMCRQKANDRTWQEADGSAHEWACRFTQTHAKHICPGGKPYSDVNHCRESGMADLLSHIFSSSCSLHFWKQLNEHD